MNDFTKEDTVYFFEFLDCDKLYPLEINDMLICSERFGGLDEYSQENAIFGKSQNELIDNFIKKLEELKR
jgi:hypothetical protein